ncbi:MAG: PQQ-binding-like beta-propeller repeat protein [Planctomycetaceae bacterium]
MSDIGWIGTRWVLGRGGWLAAALAALGGVVVVSSGFAAPPGESQEPRVRTLSRPRQQVPVRRVALQSAGVPDLPGAAMLPQFLGAGRNNQSADKGLAATWPDGGPKYVTKLSGLGVGFSCFSIADGRLYTAGNLEEREYVLAMNLADGSIAWKYDISRAYKNSFGDGPRSTPTLDGDRLYAVSATGDLVCLQRADGKEVWRRNIVEEYKSKIPNWGICESVLIDGDRLICTPGGSEATLVALDKLTGKEVWRGKSPDNDRPGYSSILPIDVSGQKQYVQFTAKGVLGFRASDGGYLWRDDSSANGTANCSAPVYADGMVFTSSGYGKGASMVQVARDGENATANLGYHIGEMKNHHGGLVLHEGHVYGSSDSGGCSCIELKTGKKVWNDRSVGKGAVTFADGKLLLRDESAGKVALIKATPEKYEELGRLEQPDRSGSKAWTYPVVFAGRLFLRDQNDLHVYDLR